MGWTKQESVCHLLFCLLGNSGLTLACERGIGNQNCSGHLSFPLIRYSRWLGSNPKIAPDIIASEARPAASRGEGGPGGGALMASEVCLQRGEGSLALPAAREGGQPFPPMLASGGKAQPVLLFCKKPDKFLPVVTQGLFVKRQQIPLIQTGGGRTLPRE